MPLQRRQRVALSEQGSSSDEYHESSADEAYSEPESMLTQRASRKQSIPRGFRFLTRIYSLEHQRSIWEGEWKVTNHQLVGSFNCTIYLLFAKQGLKYHTASCPTS